MKARTSSERNSIYQGGQERCSPKVGLVRGLSNGCKREATLFLNFQISSLKTSGNGYSYATCYENNINCGDWEIFLALSVKLKFSLGI